MASDNRQKALSEVVTLEAWHDRFGPKSKKVDLHVDVVFSTGRIGGEPESPVRFKLSIRRAEVVLVISPTEPVEVDIQSVSRDSAYESVKLEKVQKKSSKKALKGSVGLKSSPELNLQAGWAGEDHSNVTLKSIISAMSVVQSKTSSGEYRWTLRSNVGSSLDGRPWNASDRPRASITDVRSRDSRSMSPSVSVEVRCMRDDLEIADIVLKDESLFSFLRARESFRNNLAAAEAAIRERLIKEGLVVGDISDPYAELRIAMTVAQEV